MKKIKYYIASYFYLLTGQMIKKYNRMWDKKLQKLLDNNKVLYHGGYTVSIGTHSVW